MIDTHGGECSVKEMVNAPYANGPIKRAMDFVVGMAALVICIPVWVSAIVLIMLSDPGPIFFRQERVGLGGRPFLILKFRSMYANNGNVGTVTTREDQRVFNGGNFLRRFKIDELPQLLIVLNGSMSLVGPRPTVLDDFERMTPEQRRRFDVRPGITGLAQISGNTELPWSKRIEYDLEYIENASLWIDIKIILKTVMLVVTGKAETHPKGDDEWGE